MTNFEYKCLLCNYSTENRHSLPNHIHSKHGLTAKEYYDTYFKKDTEGICPTCGKPTKFRNMFFGYNEHCCTKCSSLDPNVINKSKETNNLIYGCDYHVQTIENQVKSHTNEANLKRNIHKKETFDKKYGCHPMQTEQSKAKLIQTNNALYGGNSPSNDQNVMKKILTKVNKKNTELECYEYLCSLYTTVIREYKSELYPFKCDFYIKDIDTYIELNFFWMHGKHKFDECNQQDKQTLAIWLEHAKTMDSYKKAVYIWTERDILKYTIAQQNKLNYLVFYNKNEFYEYFATNK